MAGEVARASGAPDRFGRSWQLEPGVELGPWRVLEPLGAGGMGEVYVAEHCWLPTRRAAVKVLQLDRGGTERFADRFRAEAALLASIDHPNVVRLYDAQITDDGRAWMAMELLAGKALSEVMRARGPIAVPEALQVLADIADGAHAAHLLGIVHRDLKPGNVFITNKHVAKVLDFGTSKLLQKRFTLQGIAASTEKNMVLGTIPYMSPEQLLGDAIDHRSDIYALGVIAYQMLSGRHPFVDDGEPCGAEQIGYRALLGEPVPIDRHIQGCPMELWLLVRSALGRKREDRPASMAKMAEKLRELRGHYLAERGLPIAPLGGLLEAEPAGADRVVAQAAPARGGEPPRSMREVRATVRMDSSELPNAHAFEGIPNGSPVPAPVVGPMPSPGAGASARAPQGTIPLPATTPAPMAAPMPSTSGPATGSWLERHGISARLVWIGLVVFAITFSAIVVAAVLGRSRSSDSASAVPAGSAEPAEPRSSPDAPPGEAERAAAAAASEPEPTDADAGLDSSAVVASSPVPATSAAAGVGAQASGPSATGPPAAPASSAPKAAATGSSKSPGPGTSTYPPSTASTTASTKPLPTGLIFH